MKSLKKHTFYPEQEVELELRGIPRGQLSERVNDLILKGLSFERQQEVAMAYQKYDLALSQTAARNSESSSVRVLSAAAFQAEDEVEDFV